MKAVKSEPIKTILTITIGFLIIYLVTKLSWALYVALIIGISGIGSDYLAKKIEYIWLKLSHVLSLIVPNILLSIVFYILLFPISMLSRLFSKQDPLQLKNDNSSTFKTVEKKFDAKTFENPW